LFKGGSTTSKKHQQQQHHQHQPEHPRNVIINNSANGGMGAPAEFRSGRNGLQGGGGGYANGGHYHGAGAPTAAVAPNPQKTFVNVNDRGHRVTTTTVRVPPQQQQEAPPSPRRAGTGAVAPPPPATTDPQQPPPQAAAVDPIHAANDTTRSLVKKFIADIWNRGEIDLIPEVCSPNLRFNGNAGFDRVGHDGLARMVATIRESLDEYHCEIHSMVVENNKAFCRLRFTGKHTGPLLGYDPTGKVVAWMGATEFTCQNGKILKVWELGDVKSLEEQLQRDEEKENGGRRKATPVSSINDAAADVKGSGRHLVEEDEI